MSVKLKNLDIEKEIKKIESELLWDFGPRALQTFPEVKEIFEAIAVVEVACEKYLAYLKENKTELPMTRKLVIETINNLREDLVHLDETKTSLREAINFRLEKEKKPKEYVLVMETLVEK